MKEEWRPVIGYEEYYLVSTLGAVYSQRTKKLLKGIIDNGYVFLNLSVMGERRKIPVHRIVATAFIDNPESKPQVNHLNGVTWDNRVENLEWVTASENSTHAVRTGLAPSRQGGGNGQAALTDEIVEEILTRYKPYCRINGCGALAREFGVTTSAVHAVVTGRTWTHVQPGQGKETSIYIRYRG